MTILFHRPTPWSSKINCSTKIYSKLFAEKGHNVIYLQSNVNLYHLITRRGYYKVWKEGSYKSDGVWVTCAFSLIPYLDKFGKYSKLFIKLSYFLCIPSIRKSVLAAGYGNPQVIWTTIPGSTILKDIFPKSTLIFHCIDSYSAYRGLQIIGLELQDYKKADHVFVIGESLKIHIKSLGIPENKITNLGQGVDIRLYRGEIDCPTDLVDVKSPIAIWVGVVEKIDMKFLACLEDSMSRRGGSVVIIGPDKRKLMEKYRSSQNVFFLGPKTFSEVPKYLQNSDIGVMLYSRSNQEIYAGQHPLKLYEYAAAGLPIISTWHDEYDTLKPPILLIDNEKDIEAAVDNALVNPTVWREKVLTFASENSWLKCLSRAEIVITNKIKNKR